MDRNGVIALLLVIGLAQSTWAQGYQVEETERRIVLRTPLVEAAINREGYVSGVAAQSFLHRASGFRDPGFGLDIVDWLMEPGSDLEYRDQLPEELVYRYNNLVHGQRAKRSIEGPQICTKARKLEPEVIRGKDFVAIREQYRYHLAAPGKKSGSVWTQYLVFPVDTTYFIAMDRIDSANDSDALFLRIDMPGHIRHNRGDTFSEIYLSYIEWTNDDGGYRDGRIPATAFFEDFPPDKRFHYVRSDERLPARFIRACRLRDPRSGNLGPWLAGMTLDPAAVYEAWCHQRGYVCMIEEIGGRPIKAGESFSAAYIVGYFDTIDQMHQVYDRYKGANRLIVDQTGWRLVP
ncbi:MAG: hypothetical protein KatS3mg110_3504 [Pirellulaceae bacterium]|nr:MAG: hypothetical protein KatS3mg110_3504 [Pirellulaceae bacterium]